MERWSITGRTQENWDKKCRIEIKAKLKTERGNSDKKCSKADSN